MSRGSSTPTPQQFREFDKLCNPLALDAEETIRHRYNTIINHAVYKWAKKNEQIEKGFKTLVKKHDSKKFNENLDEGRKRSGPYTALWIYEVALCANAKGSLFILFLSRLTRAYNFALDDDCLAPIKQEWKKGKGKSNWLKQRWDAANNRIKSVKALLESLNQYPPNPSHELLKNAKRVREELPSLLERLIKIDEEFLAIVTKSPGRSDPKLMQRQFIIHLDEELANICFKRSPTALRDIFNKVFPKAADKPDESGISEAYIKRILRNTNGKKAKK